MDYYIFRHAQTYYSKFHVEYGKHVKDAEIFTEGIRPIKNLANYLINIPTDKNFVSPYKRCIDTANIVSGITGKKFEIDERLRDHSPAFGDSVKKLGQRITSFFEYLKQGTFKSVIICSHGFPIAMLKTLVLEGSINFQKLDDYPKPGVLLIIKEGKAEEINFTSPNPKQLDSSRQKSNTTSVDQTTS